MSAKTGALMNRKMTLQNVVSALMFLLALQTSSLTIRPALAQKLTGGAVAPASRLPNSDKAADGDLPRSVTEDKSGNVLSSRPPSDKALVTGLRFLTSKSYTRVMLDLSQETKYEVRRLKEDAAKGMPPPPRTMSLYSPIRIGWLLMWQGSELPSAHQPAKRHREWNLRVALRSRQRGNPPHRPWRADYARSSWIPDMAVKIRARSVPAALRKKTSC